MEFLDTKKIASSIQTGESEWEEKKKTQHFEHDDKIPLQLDICAIQ